MRKLFVLSALALGAPCFAAPSARLSDDDPGQERRYDTNYYLDEEDPYAPGSPGDSDLGEQRQLVPTTKAGQFLLTAETFTFWSNNQGYTDRDEQEGWAGGAWAELRWRRRLGNNFIFNAYAYQDVYRYDADDLDYESTEAGMGLVKLCPNFGDLLFFFRYEFLYVHGDDVSGDLNNRLHRVRAGVGKTVWDNPDHSIYVSANTRFDIDGNPGSQERFQNSGRVSWSWRLSDRLRSTAYYRLSFRDYRHSSRQDWHQDLGWELGYGLNQWLDLYASVLYSYNDSNTRFQDYEVLETGVAAGLTARF